MKTALICGILGQDGGYLAQLLVRKGYRVCGTSRSVPNSGLTRLEQLGIQQDVELFELDPLDYPKVRQTLHTIQPAELYNLSGQSSVGLSFAEPRSTFESIAVANLHWLEALRELRLRTRLFFAGSGECFGDTGATAAEENMPFSPQSPYAAAKAAAHFQVVTYRKAYQVFACSGFLFNHESPLRGETFVTSKVIRAAQGATLGPGSRTRFGDLSVVRDFGWAPEYVDAMWRTLQIEQPEDFVIATGKAVALEEFVEHAFRLAGLDFRDHILIDQSLFRASEIRQSRANPAKAERLLGWRAQHAWSDVVRMLLEARPSVRPSDLAEPLLNPTDKERKV